MSGGNGERRGCAAGCGRTVGLDARGLCWWCNPDVPEAQKLGARSKGGNAPRPGVRLLTEEQARALADLATDEGRRRLREACIVGALTGVDPARINAVLTAARDEAAEEDRRERRRIADALLRLESGGLALAVLARLTEGLEAGRRRPLPGRVVTMAPAGEGAA